MRGNGDNQADLSATLYSPTELLGLVGARARDRRLASHLRQADVAAAAGVTLSTLRRFESGVSVRFDAIVRIALALRAENELSHLFQPPQTHSLDQVLNASRKRSRARKRV